MRQAVLVFLAVGFIQSISMGAAPNAAVEKTIQVDGLERHYLVFVPDKAKEPTPVVIALHGGGGNAQQMERSIGFDDLAEKHGFIVVYPDSLGGYWNDGRGVEFMRAQKENINDVKFIRSLLDELAKDHRIDHGRVFVTGISNGGFMSHRLAAEASDLIAGIAPVVGGMAPTIAEKFDPQFPVSILIIQGDSDPIVPIDGGDVVGRGSTRGKVISAKAALDKYIERNGNPREPVKAKLDAKSQDDKAIEIAKYPDGPGGVKTWFYLVKNGSHAWPGRSQIARRNGRVKEGFSATETIWEFFEICPPRSGLKK